VFYSPVELHFVLDAVVFQIPPQLKCMYASGNIDATLLKSDRSTTKKLMRLLFSILTFTVSATFFVSCKKEDKKKECFPGVTTVRQIADKSAVVKVTATVNVVYLVEQGAIDTKLIPCNLPKDYMQNDLQVIVSGDVKATQQGFSPCCSENFVKHLE